MKKAVSFLLALAVLCSLATVSFAADTAAELPIRWLDYDAVSWWSSELGLLQYEEDGALGLCRVDGTRLTEPIYEEISWLSAGDPVKLAAAS